MEENKNLEVMDDVVETEEFDYPEEASGSGKVILLAAAGTAALATGIAMAVKKLKGKKPKRYWKIVRVEEEAENMEPLTEDDFQDYVTYVTEE